MCTEEDHEIKARILFKSLLCGYDYNADLKCGECGEIILSIRNGKLYNKPLDDEREKAGSGS